jgi:hypothetical protein
MSCQIASILPAVPVQDGRWGQGGKRKEVIEEGVDSGKEEGGWVNEWMGEWVDGWMGE